MALPYPTRLPALPPVMQAGEKVTALHHTDRTAHEILEVRHGGDRLLVRACTATLLNGPRSGEPDALVQYPGGFAAHTSGTQRWDVQSDPHGERRTLSWRPTVRAWVAVGSPSSGSTRYVPGGSWYHDFNF